jgi:hypothetical protein
LPIEISIEPEHDLAIITGTEPFELMKDYDEARLETWPTRILYDLRAVDDLSWVNMGSLKMFNAYAGKFDDGVPRRRAFVMKSRSEEILARLYEVAAEMTRPKFVSEVSVFDSYDEAYEWLISE